MIISRRRIAQSIASQLQNGVDRSGIAQRLAAYVVEHKLTGQVDEIMSDIAYELSRRGTLEATITTARPLSDELREMVRDYLAREEAMKAVILHERIDESLLGGIIIDTPSRRLDASVASRLKELKTA